ncbi:leucine-rich_repeat domain-containing protein [Hexamita inflata]|uniref:Leucine-rich repeat domain-containing protein n=1 Tax=Hexamita inflata TaxID=28002 RepID=A0AA86RPW4_9EUKA|nr:leucine-rich repeat domain-containing protein [Hexamita inflata]
MYQNQNTVNKLYDAKMTRRYESKINNGSLEIAEDPEVTNLRFLEKFDISTLNLYISNEMSVKLRSNSLKKLTVFNSSDQDEEKQQRLNMNVDDLELENLEVLMLEQNYLENDQLYNLAKFKKLHTLIVSLNYVDLTNIHSVTSLTSLTMQECGFQNIDQIGLLTNLEYLDVSANQLLNIDQIYLLVNLKELYISQNWGLNIDPLKHLHGLTHLAINKCDITQLSALKPLINLQYLNLSYNDKIIITELQYLKNIISLDLTCCELVSVYVLRPLVNIEYLDISRNTIVYIDAHLNEMKKLEQLKAEWNRISDFSSIEKHNNYNNFDQNVDRCFDITYQQIPSQEELFNANKQRCLESPNIKLKEIQINCRTFKTSFTNFKNQINTNMNSYNHIQFTSSVAHLFEKLTQVISQ